MTQINLNLWEINTNNIPNTIAIQLDYLGEFRKQMLHNYHVACMHVLLCVCFEQVVIRSMFVIR